MNFNLSIKSRLLALAALALLGIGLVAALAVLSNRVNIAALQQLYEEDSGSVVQLMSVENSLLEVRFRTAGVLLDQLPVPGSLNHLREVRASLGERWATLTPLLDKVFEDSEAAHESVALLSQLRQHWTLVDSTLAKLEQAYEAKNREELARLLEEEWPLMHKEAIKPLQGLIPLAQQQAEQDFVQARAKSRSMLGTGIAGGLLCMLALGALALYTLRAVLGPLREVEYCMEKIAQGQLNTTLPAAREDELGRMIAGLGAMQAQLQSVVGEVRRSSDSIATASAQISMGTQDLSQRTEQTASNLQQTAASMELLTQAVRQSADSAAQADQMARAAATVAARGGTVVAQVVNTMDEISSSSSRIADIIGVIDGIAFQTNILALNAAVEAARAGEQGRGFAVVASEVRSLAGRSAEAAKEIKSLIHASAERVESGSQLVADAGATMRELVSSVKRVSDIIGEISAASAEQSGGIGRVNGSVTQLDQMTQQNAALVEESAAAAESLQDQAQKLGLVMGGFKL
ncbi:hypothetical protein DBR47_04220 [Paucibacter sp. KBW04]|uniref:methyl-accepting chemotaxis protein n=1 Tax=Paucibacter sp. KBW04 TaxID=2153361 RepID=UPI000F565E5A|nr:methyl-accepting chemotaxis protein [Paucibacter sp. KBW04]RQO62665.1 hypothetical protein DBR47_04220 [Paucibacter sp. KBW04]